MMARPDGDPILRRFRTALDRLYGDQIERVVLFGSRARGEVGPESDYDVALFLKSPLDQRAERRRLADLRVEFLDETGMFFETMPFPGSAYRDRTPLMHEIRRDGLDI